MWREWLSWTHLRPAAGLLNRPCFFRHWSMNSETGRLVLCFRKQQCPETSRTADDSFLFSSREAASGGLKGRARHNQRAITTKRPHNQRASQPTGFTTNGHHNQQPSQPSESWKAKEAGRSLTQREETTPHCVGLIWILKIKWIQTV